MQPGTGAYGSGLAHLTSHLLSRAVAAHPCPVAGTALPGEGRTEVPVLAQCPAAALNAL